MDWPSENHKKVKVSKLVPYARNARTHSDEQVSQVAASIKEWGWTNPVLIDEDHMIIAGHGRVLAAKKLGLEHVPCLVSTGWTDAQKKAYVLADNQLALNAGWDDNMLRVELEELGDLDFDIDLVGFDNDFLGELFDESKGIVVGDDLDDLELDEMLVKFDPVDIVEITNVLQGAVKKYSAASVWYKDEQI